MKIAVVIAAYNESETIRPLTVRLVQELHSLKDTSWKLIYVIEGMDGTVEIARDFAAQHPEIEILYNERPTGLGRAFRRGFDALPADTDFVVTMDADLNHQPEEIPRLLAAAQRKQADIVVGSRRMEDSSVEGMPPLKMAVSRGVNRTMHVLMGLGVNDLTSGFRVYRASALRRLEFENNGFAFLPEILIGAAAGGLRVIEEPIRFTVRRAGLSKMHIAATIMSYMRLFATLYRFPSWRFKNPW
jgi:dolichol-phosphate mannosyltransferase